MKYRLQSMYNDMVGRTASVISPFYSLLPERIQCLVGRFILQVPQSTSRVLVWCDGAQDPVQAGCANMEYQEDQEQRYVNLCAKISSRDSKGPLG